MKVFTFFIFLTYSLSFTQQKIHITQLPENKSQQFVDSILSIPYDKALKNTKIYLNLVEQASSIVQQTKDSATIAKAFSKLSLGYHFTSKFDLSIEYNLKAARIYQKLKDIDNFAFSYLTLGWQIKNRDLHKGIYYMKKGIRILENKKPNSNHLLFGYNNYGVLKKRAQQIDSALYFHKKALKLSIDKQDSVAIPFAQTHIAEVYLFKREFKKAKELLNKALKIRITRNDSYGITDSYLYLGDLYFAKKDYKSAIVYFKKAEKKAIENTYFPLRKYATEYLFKSYELDQKPQKALYYHKLFTQLKDSILNTERNNKIAELEIEFNTSEKERQIAIQKIAIQKKNLHTVLLCSTLLFFAIVFFAIYKRNQLKREQLEKEISLKDALATIKTQNRLQEQRLRISRDLHDNIGAQLTFIISSLDNLKFVTKDLDKVLKEKLIGISSFTSETIQQLRDTIWAMNKSEISAQDLHSRILSFIEKAKNTGIATSFEIKNNLENTITFSSLEGMNIFRIVQEAINNAIKYAEAKHVSVYLIQKDKQISVSIKDNGKGFDLSKTQLGNGLNNMEKRASEINGKVYFDSKINSGTTIKIIL